MPKVKVEVLRTRTVTIEESGVVELNVPKRVIDGDDINDLTSWIEERSDESTDFAKLIDEAMEASDEQETIEYSEVTIVD